MVQTVSEKGLQFVAQREACVLTAYQDGHKLAIGFGDNRSDLKEGDTITMDEAVTSFVHKSKFYEAMVIKLFPGIDLMQHHFDALFSLVYNYGARGLKEKTTVVPLVQRYYTTGADTETLREIGETIASQPTNNKRRRREAAMFVSGDYGDLSDLLLWEGVPATTPPKIVPMPTFLEDK